MSIFDKYAVSVVSRRECGNKLLEFANGMDEYLPNYCSNCGAKVVE